MGQGYGMRVTLAAILALALVGCVSAERRFQVSTEGLQRESLVSFGSQQELDLFLERAMKSAEARRIAGLTAVCAQRRGAADRPRDCDEFEGTNTSTNASAVNYTAVEVPMDLGGDSATLESVTVVGSRIDPSDIITNNQEAGVDEGDIVKKSGDFVLVLRQGVLHSIRIQRNGLAVLELSDRLGVAVDKGGEDVWYDEILVAGERVMLLGFNYGEDRAVAELLLFTLDGNGRLAREGRFWLRTDDYFDDNNYGARLQGDNLLLTLSMPLEKSGEMAWPEWSRRDVPTPQWTPLVDAEDLLYPVLFDEEPHLHVVMQCPLSGLDGAELSCRSTGIVGNLRSVIYATPTHAYLALRGWDRQAFFDPVFSSRDWGDEATDEYLARYQRSAILRIPFQPGKAPDFAVVPGSIDLPFQFQQAADGSLFVAAFGPRSVDLVRIRTNQFQPAVASAQLPLATLPIDPDQWPVVRFSPDALWLGQGAFDLANERGPSRLQRLPLDGSPARSVMLPQSSDLLQPAFGHVLSVGVGNDDALSFTLVSDTPQPRALTTATFPEYDPAESRSHALNFGQLPTDVRLIGLPGMPDADSGHQDERAADLLYLQLRGTQLLRAGILDMRGQPEPDDICGNCYDWYGNARTFFVGSRVFALSANLIKEAQFDGRQVVETRQLVLP